MMVSKQIYLLVVEKVDLKAEMSDALKVVMKDNFVAVLTAEWRVD